MALAARFVSAVDQVVHALARKLTSHAAARSSTSGFGLEPLESRKLLSAALDLIGVNALRDDPVFDGIDGSGMTVAVIDTGVDFSHPLISGAKLAEHDMVYGGSTARLTDEHGTHVAGILGARNDDIGVAPGVGLIGLQVFTESRNGGIQAYDADIEKALVWVLDNYAKYNIVAVNMSLGSGNYLSAAAADTNILFDEVKRLEAAGITVVSAAGNSYAQLEKQGSATPAVFSTLDVGAVYETNEGRRSGAGGTDYSTDADRLAYFSQRPNTSNQIFAPGAYITSTVPGGKTKDLAGTSMAAPMVTGTVALMQEAAVQFGGRKLSTTEVQTLIRQTADKINDGDDENTSVKTTGADYLRVNTYNAVKAVRNLFTGAGDPTAEVDPNGTIASSVAGPTLAAALSTPIQSNIGMDGSTDVGSDDVDLYRLVVTAPGDVSIDVDTTAFQAAIRIFNAAGTPVDLTTADGDSGITRTVALQSGAYYVGVSASPNTTYNPNIPGSGADGGSTGNYSIRFALDTADADGVLTGATDINVNAGNAAQALNASIGKDGSKTVGAGDVDFYRVTVPDDGTLLVDVDTIAGSTHVDTYLRVFDANGVQKSFSDDDVAEGITGETLEFLEGTSDLVDANGAFQGHKTDSFIGGAVTKGTVYYIAVSNYDNRGFAPNHLDSRVTEGETGGYNLYVSFRNGDVNGAIPQAVNTAALPLAKNPGEIGSDGTDTGLVNVGDRDVDFIKLNSPVAGILKIDIDSFNNANGISNTVDSVVRLFDREGTLLAMNDDGPDGPDPLLYYEIAAATDYYVAVSGAGNDNFDPFLLGSGGNGDTGDYFFNASVLAAQEASALSDDTAGDGGVRRLFLDEPLSDRLGEDAGFAKGNVDVDLFAFAAPFSGSFTFLAGPDDAFGADTFLRVFDAAGTELAKDDNGGGNTGGSKIAIDLVAGQNYLIGVSGAGPNAAAYNPITGEGAGAGDTGGYTLEVSAGDRVLIFGPDNDASYMDADGTNVVITMRGPGSGSIFFGGEGDVDASRIVVENTTEATVITINGQTSVGEFIATGSLRNLVARESAVVGNMTISGSVKSIQIGSLSNSRVQIGAGGLVSLTTGAVTDSSIDSSSPIKQLRTASWTDSNGDDAIVAPTIRQLVSAGDFSAGVRASAVGQVKVGGKLGGSVRSSGNIDLVNAGSLGNVKIFAGVADAVTGLPGAVGDFVLPSATLKSMVVKSSESGAFGTAIIAAPLIKRAIIGDVAPVGGSAQVGVVADVAKLIRGTIAGQALKLRKLDEPTDSMEEGSFVVRVV